MGSIKEIMESVDVATQQALWFYELCKIGVVRFSLSNEDHVKILTEIINKVNDYNVDDYKNESKPIQLEMESKHQLLYLISVQLLRHTIE